MLTNENKAFILSLKQKIIATIETNL